MANDFDLGKSTSYAYYVSEGGTKTPQEFGEMLVNIDTVATRAEESASDAEESATSANESKESAIGAKDIAIAKANEASASADIALNKAGEASASATVASNKANEASASATTASAKATESSQNALTAVNAKNDAVSAKNDAVIAKTQAESAKDNAVSAKVGAESARDQVQSSASQIAQNASDISELKEDLSDVRADIVNFADSVLNTDGSFVPQTITTVSNSYVFAQSGSQYNGRVNSSSNYGYAVVPVKFNDLVKVSGRANSNAPICVFLKDSTPSVTSYVGVYEFVTTGTTYADQLIPIPIGVTHIAVNTNNTSTFPISVSKFVSTETVTQLWQAGYLDSEDATNMLSVDGTFTALSPTIITDKAVYASDTSYPQYSGDTINSTNAAYTVIAVKPRDIIRVSGQAGATTQSVIWLNSDTPSRASFVGAAEYVSTNTLYTKKSWSVPDGVTHAAINTINRNSYPIAVEKYASSKSVANLYQAYTVDLFTEPLHVLRDETGMLDLFLKVGCIGDSLASGESASNNGGTVAYHDLYQYSWGQFLARKTGNTYYNWSQGGLTTKTWLESSYATECYDGEHNCTAYIIGLGENDKNTSMTIGTSADINLSDYTQNADTFYGNYGKIIQKIQEIVPKAKIFILTDFALSMETSGFNAAIRTIAALFDNVYLLDLYTYGQDVYNKLKKVIRSGHYGAYGYKVAAMVISTYINWIVENNVSDFSQVEFIDTEWSWTE